MVFSAAIEEEWNKHQSGFARTWRRSMFAREKIDKIDVATDKTLRAQLEKVSSSETQGDEMLKDAPLIEAAHASGMRVVSLDHVRDHFRMAAMSVSQLREVCWVNPDNPDENPLKWLQVGAPADRFRKLGHVSADE